MASFKLCVVLCILSTVTGQKFTHLKGRFGDQTIPLEITFGDDVMVVTSYTPEGAQDSFRPSSNLHIFKTRLVAARNSLEKICYVQPFNATEDQMKERVQNAIVNEGDFGDIKEERVSLQGLRPLLQRSVKRILGAEIAKFCDLHQVYILSHNNYYLLQPQDVQQSNRVKRYIRDPPGQGYLDDSYRADVIGDPNDGPSRPKFDIPVVC